VGREILSKINNLWRAVLPQLAPGPLSKPADRGRRGTDPGPSRAAGGPLPADRGPRIPARWAPSWDNAAQYAGHGSRAGRFRPGAAAWGGQVLRRVSGSLEQAKENPPGGIAGRVAWRSCARVLLHQRIIFIFLQETFERIPGAVFLPRRPIVPELLRVVPLQPKTPARLIFFNGQPVTFIV